MIVFNNWCIENVGEFGYQYDNLSRLLLVHGAPDGYRWQMNIKAGENFDVLDLDQMDDVVGVVLTKEHLSVTGYYELQLVGTLLSDGVTVRHTNVIRVFVPPSLSGDAHWPELPSEFSAAEQRIRELNSHPPIPGDNGYWLTWDLTVKAYVGSEFPLPEGSGGSGGTTDHSKLSNREAIDQHPMSAITGLEAALEGKQPAGAYLTRETDPTVPDWAKAATKPSYTADEVGALSADTLPAAINIALAQAKESGEFDGAPGQNGDSGPAGADGVGIQSVEQTTTSTEDGGTNIVTVTRTDGTASTFEVRNGSRGSAGPAGADGKDGAKGPAGADGYTPVRGTDYWTADDIAAIQSYVDEAILGGAW